MVFPFVVFRLTGSSVGPWANITPSTIVQRLLLTPKKAGIWILVEVWSDQLISYGSSTRPMAISLIPLFSRSHASIMYTCPVNWLDGSEKLERCGTCLSKGCDVEFLPEKHRGALGDNAGNVFRPPWPQGRNGLLDGADSLRRTRRARQERLSNEV